MSLIPTHIPQKARLLVALIQQALGKKYPRLARSSDDPIFSTEETESIIENLVPWEQKLLGTILKTAGIAKQRSDMYTLGHYLSRKGGQIDPFKYASKTRKAALEFVKTELPPEYFEKFPKKWRAHTIVLGGPDNKLHQTVGKAEILISPKGNTWLIDSYKFYPVCDNAFNHYWICGYHNTADRRWLTAPHVPPLPEVSDRPFSRIGKPFRMKSYLGNIHTVEKKPQKQKSEILEAPSPMWLTHNPESPGDQ